jgi:hypothetical protein
MRSHSYPRYAPKFPLSTLAAKRRFGYACPLVGATMHVKTAAIIIGLVAAATPALAKDPYVRKPTTTTRATAHRIAVPRPVPKTRIAAVPTAAAPILEQTKGVLHRRGARVAPKSNKDRETGIVAALERDSPALPANFPADAVGWRLIEDPVTGARIGLPEKLVPHAGTARSGSRWTSAQGQIQIETFRLTEAALPALFEDEKKAAHRHTESGVLKPDFFVIAGVQGLKNFFVRADAHGSEVRGITILYDQATEGTMGRVAHVMLNAFAGFPDPNAAPLPGMRRLVEYGTAIVVSGDGDLITAAHLTDECQAITVSGFGHADRTAEDKTNDLALIRLYGARNLVPATLADDGSLEADIGLVGIADPLAQAGGAGVSRAAARLTAQGLEPAPKLGFSGAAAVDARGGLAGMVDLKPPSVAGSGSAGQGPTLIPVGAIRMFLQAHGISPAAASAGRAAMEQSVVRVICVRR